MANSRVTLIEEFHFEWVRLTQFREELFWIVLGQVLMLAGGMVGIKLLTNVMGPEKYGQLALGITIAGLLNLFVYGPISSTALRFCSIYRNMGQLPIYYYVLKKAHSICALLLGILLLGAAG